MTSARPSAGTTDVASADRTDPARPVGNPFPGPKAYQWSDQRYFFGRTDEIEELTSLVLSSSATLLYAPSGAGKSSLLQAGVAPHLESRFKFVILPTVRLDAGVLNKSSEERPNRFVQAVCETISHGNKSNGKDIAAAARARRPDNSGRVLLVLDQFEEVFDDPGLWQERHEFFLALTAALEENTWLRAIIALRSDYLADLVPYEPSLPANLVVRYQLADMVQEQAAEVIGEAFARSGLALGDANLQVVLDALYENPASPERGPAPLQHANTIQLQIVCRTLWDELHEKYGDGPVPDGVLSRGSFNLQNSMVQFVDEAIREVMQRGYGGEAAVRWWLGHELITPLGRRGFVSVDQDAAGLPGAVIDALEEVRLVQLEQRHGLRLAELTHDSMIDGVRASNEAWLRGAHQRRRYAWISLLVILIALLAAFGPLRVSSSGIVAGPETGSLGGTTELSFTGGSGQAVTVNGSLSRHVHNAVVEVVETQPDASERVIAMRALPAPGSNLFALAARTEPGRAYVARLVADGDDPAIFNMTVFSRPAVPDGAPAMPVPPDAPGVAVLLEPTPGADRPGGVLIRVDGRSLQSGTGPNVAVFNRAQRWAVVDRPRQPGVAMFEFDPVSPGAEPKAVTVRPVSVDPPIQLGARGSVRMTVNPLQRISIDVPPSRQTGVELTCDGSDAVQVASVDPNEHKVGTPTNVGSSGTVLPLRGSGPLELVLYSGESSATCTAAVKQYGAEPIAATGRRELEVPQTAQAVAYPLNLSQDSALVIKATDDIQPSLTCSDLPKSSDDWFLAVVPARSACELWLVRTPASTGLVSVSVWVSEVADRKGG